MADVDFSELGLDINNLDAASAVTETESQEVSETTEPAIETTEAPAQETETETVAQSEPAPEPEPIAPGTEEMSERERALFAQLNRITQEVAELRAKSAAPADETPAEIEVEDHNFLEGLDIDEVLSTADGLNGLLNSVNKRGVQEGAKIAAQNILRNLPNLINASIKRQTEMNKLVDEFYASNQDLLPVRGTVVVVAGEVANENPQFTPQQVFNETATRVRTMLKLQNSGGAKPKVAAKKPAFVGQRGGRPSVPALQGLAAEIEDLIS